jgi:hypothetical protein
MTSEGLGKMFEYDSADTVRWKISASVDEGRADGLVCADPGARTPIGASGNFCSSSCYIVTTIVTLLVQQQSETMSTSDTHYSKPQKGLS